MESLNNQEKTPIALSINSVLSLIDNMSFKDGKKLKKILLEKEQIKVYKIEFTGYSKQGTDPNEYLITAKSPDKAIKKFIESDEFDVRPGSMFEEHSTSRLILYKSL